MPPTIATVNAATPNAPTLTPWPATNTAPPTPPQQCHHRNPPDRKAAPTNRRPRRPAGKAGTSASNSTMPAVVEANEAATPSPSRAPSSPFNRA
ncbi:hypothetical protein GCM10009608_55650 [Pseudonocardia alaniniphila]